MQQEIEITRGKEIVIGVLLTLAGLVTVLANWRHVVDEGLMRHGMAILAPVLFVGGIMLIAAPYPDKRHFPKAEFAPKSWNIFILVGVVLGFSNWYFMNFS
jgi:drug/metabolite transporter (DMT)-like permease